MTAKTIITPRHFPWMDLSRYTFSPAVEKGGLVFVSGNAASEYDPASGRMVCRGDVVAQCRTALEKIKAILEAAGLSFDNVVKTTDYLSPQGLEGYRGTAEVRREFFRGNWSAATGIVVERLLRPDALIEIDAIAVRGYKKELVNPGFDYFQRYTFSPAVKTGPYLWVSGFTGSRSSPQRGIYWDEGIATQMRHAFQQMGQVLSAGGSSPQKVLKTMDYVHPGGFADYRSTAEVRREFFQGSFPAATGIGMNRLLPPQALAEVDMVATTGERQEVWPPEWERYSRLTYRPGVRSGNLLFIAGMGGAVDPRTGDTIGEGDVLAQARVAYEHVARVVEVAGGTLSDVVRTVEFITPPGLPRYRETSELRRELFGSSFPAATGVVVNRLVRPQMLIEVDAIAVLG